MVNAVFLDLYWWLAATLTSGDSEIPNSSVLYDSSRIPVLNGFTAYFKGNSPSTSLTWKWKYTFVNAASVTNLSIILHHVISNWPESPLFASQCYLLITWLGLRCFQPKYRNNYIEALKMLESVRCLLQLVNRVYVRTPLMPYAGTLFLQEDKLVICTFIEQSTMLAIRVMLRVVCCSLPNHF